MSIWSRLNEIESDIKLLDKAVNKRRYQRDHGLWSKSSEPRTAFDEVDSARTEIDSLKRKLNLLVDYLKLEFVTPVNGLTIRKIPKSKSQKSAL